MKFNDLVDFIENKMRMSHIYQPLLIRTLVDAGGVATIRQLAQSFLSEDESQILFYEKRIKQMPLKVLKSHDIVEQDGQLVSLNVDLLDFKQRSQIKMLCDQRIQDFLQRRGLGPWDYRLAETDPVPDSLRFIVLKEGGGRCALCGATKDERPLDVDHIIPRSRGGKNELANLQVLCSKCNRAKGNKDTTDFRKEGLEQDSSCPFCMPQVKPKVVRDNNSVYCLHDRYPVSQGHMLVIPYRHSPDFFSMTQTERDDADSLVRFLRSEIMDEDPTVLGVNVGSNAGEVAGQTIFHAHIHLIPRRVGDTEQPRGGVRGVIPAKMTY